MIRLVGIFLITLLAAGGHSSLAEGQDTTATSSSRDTRATGDTSANRKSKNPEIEDAPPPRPIIRDNANTAPPTSPAQPIAVPAAN